MDLPASFPGVTASPEVEVADWLLESLRPWNRGIHHVATLVPAGYPAHARVFHRAATRERGDVRWADIAARTGGQLHAEADFAELVGWERAARPNSPPEPWLTPDAGSLRPEECAAVAEVLARHTTTPDDCRFCVWEGYGWANFDHIAGGAPHVEFQYRSCVLFRGPVHAATAFRSEPWFQSPTWWWPADRAWCVATELDCYSTYVAGTASAVRDLIGHPALEVLPCTAEQDIDHGPYPKA